MGRILIFAAPIEQVSCLNSTDGAVAQSVEQRTENPCVGGSIPPHTTKKIKRLRRNVVVAFSFG